MHAGRDALSTGRHPLDSTVAGLVALADAEPSREVCGFVLAGGGAAPEIVALRNAAGDPARAFRLDPRDVLDVMRRAEREHRTLAALYHSHPSGGASLSAKDLDGLTMDGGPLLPEVELWVIGMETGRAIDLRAYRWVDGGYVEVARWCAPFTV